MFVTYHQATGKLRVFNDRGKLVHEATGYAGRGAGLNNPNAEAIRSEGPIPSGLWRVHAAERHPRLGPVALALSPSGHSAFGRAGFFIHGDNRRRNFTASSGCIIVDRITREFVAYGADAATPGVPVLLRVHTDEE